MENRFYVMMSSVGITALLSGCPSWWRSPDVTTIQASSFEDMMASCLGENILGKQGQFVFLGPNQYSPGDFWTRGQNIKGVWVYTARRGYLTAVGKEEFDANVKRGTVPAGCSLKENTKLTFGAKLEAAFVSAAVPAAANAGLDFSTGTVKSIMAKKVYVSSVPYPDDYSDGLRKLPVGTPLRVALEGGGYYISSAILEVEGYTLELEYGPDFVAQVKANATVAQDASKGLKGEVKIEAKDTTTLLVTISDRVSLGAVFRPIGPDLSVLSASPVLVAGTANSPKVIAATVSARKEYQP